MTASFVGAVASGVCSGETVFSAESVSIAESVSSAESAFSELSAISFLGELSFTLLPSTINVPPPNMITTAIIAAMMIGFDDFFDLSELDDVSDR